MGHNQFISEEEVEKALDWLRDNADTMGDARERLIRAEHMVKHVKALEMRKWGSHPVNAQEREAVASLVYRAAIDEEAKAAGEYEKMKSLREAAAMKVEVWRTLGANYRAMKI